MGPFIVGIDPGQTTGICVYDAEYSDLLQCTPGAVIRVVRGMFAPLSPYQSRLLAIEKFVVGPRASRSSSARAGQTTRELIGALVELGVSLGIEVVQRSAAEVKPWATDKRLEALGLLVKGMPHAQDAARQAIYAASKDRGVPDPLSRTIRSAPRRTP